eukprot:6214620-Pleurochrysis_carterae.AAC.5
MTIYWFRNGNCLFLPLISFANTFDYRGLRIDLWPLSRVQQSGPRDFAISPLGAPVRQVAGACTPRHGSRPQTRLRAGRAAGAALDVAQPSLSPTLCLSCGLSVNTTRNAANS